MFCQKCGKQIPDISKFCPECGGEIPVEEPVKAESAPMYQEPVQPEAPVAQPEAPVAQPEAPVAQPEAPVVQPEAPVVQTQAPVQPPQYQQPAPPQYQAAPPQYQQPAPPQYQQPAQPQYQNPAAPQYQAPMQAPYQQPKKKTGLIVAICASAAVLIAGIIVALIIIFSNKGSDGGSTPVTTTPPVTAPAITTVTEPPVTTVSEPPVVTTEPHSVPAGDLNYDPATLEGIWYDESNMAYYVFQKGSIVAVSMNNSYMRSGKYCIEDSTNGSDATLVISEPGYSPEEVDIVYKDKQSISFDSSSTLYYYSGLSDITGLWLCESNQEIFFFIDNQTLYLRGNESGEVLEMFDALLEDDKLYILDGSDDPTYVEAKQDGDILYVDIDSNGDYYVYERIYDVKDINQ